MTCPIRVFAHGANVVLLGFLFIFSIAVFDTLPDRIPMHYDVHGAPDRWSDTTMISWLLVPGIAAGLTLLFYLLALWIPALRKRPEMVNMPAASKKKFLALSEERRGKILKGLASYIYWFPVMVNLTMIIIRYAEYIYITGKTESFSGLWAIAIPVVGIPLLIIFMFRSMRQMIDET